MKTTFTILLLTLVAATLSAQSLVWDGTANSLSIGNKVAILRDSTHRLTIAQVSSVTLRNRFLPSKQVILNPGFTDTVFWIRVTIDNTTQDHLLLEMAQAFLPITELYYRNDAGKWIKMTAGYRIPVNWKILKNHFQDFPLPAGKHEYYVRFQAHSQPIPITIWETSAYEIKTYRQRLVYGFYLGLMFYVFLSNLFFFFSLRNRMYLFYACIVVLYTCYGLAVMDGFIVYFFDHVNLTFCYITIPTIGVTVQTIYCLLFLEAAKYVPRINRIVWGVVIYFAVYMVLKYFLPIRIILAVNTANALLSFFLMGFVGIQVGRKGNPLGYYFASAYGIYFLLVLTDTVYIQTGSPGYIAEVSYVTIATLIESFILSFLLSKRFEWERRDLEKDKADAQRALLEKTRENEQLLLNQNELLEQQVVDRTTELKKSLEDLKLAQQQLINTEKMAALGELMAGIAHEIQNPLNFVNNISEISTDVVSELQEAIRIQQDDQVQELTEELNQNLHKINHHGKRASTIVKDMLLHSRTRISNHQLTDLNTLIQEYLNLAYQGYRSIHPQFHCQLIKELDSNLDKVTVQPQEIGRVLLNLYNNGFYAMQQKQLLALPHDNGLDDQPTLRVSSQQLTNQIELQVKDNGLGIAEAIQTKIFQPFFTTKPTGQGTGLGLSLSYDIITKGHRGTLSVESQPGQGTTFIIRLPMNKPNDIS